MILTALALALPGCDFALGYDDVIFLHGDAATAIPTEPPPTPDPEPSEDGGQGQEAQAGSAGAPSQVDASPSQQEDAAGSAGAAGASGSAGSGGAPDQETIVRNEILAVANAEVGFCSSDARPYMLQQPGLWCWDFVDWVYQQAGQHLGMSLPAPDDLKQIWSKSPPSGWLPEGGDMIKFWIQHYGLVETSSADGAQLSTIEGNYNDCVVKVDRSRGEVNWFGSLDGIW